MRCQAGLPQDTLVNTGDAGHVDDRTDTRDLPQVLEPDDRPWSGVEYQLTVGNPNILNNVLLMKPVSVLR